MIPAELEFNHPEAIRWLWLVAIVAAIAPWRSRGRIRQLRRFAEAPLLAQIAPRVSLARPVARTIVTLAAMGMLVVALLDPRWGFQYEEVQRRGLDCFFVVDVSRSFKVTMTCRARSSALRARTARATAGTKARRRRRD